MQAVPARDLCGLPSVLEEARTHFCIRDQLDRTAFEWPRLMNLRARNFFKPSNLEDASGCPP
jgi:hypothetical protein